MKGVPHFFVAFLIAGQALGETLFCADPLLTVTGGDADTRTRACTAAVEARERLQSCNVGLDRRIEIAIVDNFDEQATACLGLYHCGEDRIEILPPEKFTEARDRKGAFELISDDAYWNSILAHELTHAAYDTVKCPFTACVATSEYASYAMQVYSLPDSERQLFGKEVVLRSAPSYDSISEVMLFLSPDRFAKIAWLHFQSQDTPCLHMQHIMDGNIFFDREPL